MSILMLPAHAAGDTRGTVLKWYKQPGDWVRPGERLFSYIVPSGGYVAMSETEGRLTAIYLPEGESAACPADVALLSPPTLGNVFAFNTAPTISRRETPETDDTADETEIVTDETEGTADETAQEAESADEAVITVSEEVTEITADAEEVAEAEATVETEEAAETEESVNIEEVVETEETAEVAENPAETAAAPEAPEVAGEMAETVSPAPVAAALGTPSPEGLYVERFDPAALWQTEAALHLAAPFHKAERVPGRHELFTLAAVRAGAAFLGLEGWGDLPTPSLLAVEPPANLLHVSPLLFAALPRDPSLSHSLTLSGSDREGFVALRTVAPADQAEAFVLALCDELENLAATQS